MPNEYANTPYKMAHRSAVLPPSHGESVKPDFLLHHENHFDRNTYTPEQTGAFKPEPIKTA